MAKNKQNVNKNNSAGNAKKKPFNSALFDGLSAIKKHQQEEEAQKAKEAKEASERLKELQKKTAAASGYHFDEHKSDEELWAAYTGDTKKLKKDKVERVSAPPAKKTFAYVDDDADVMAELSGLVNGEVPFCYENNDEYQSGHIQAVDEATMRALRNGEMPFTDHLDLHGFTADEAKKNLKRFLISRRQNGHRCVLVVTGRGLNSPDKVAVIRGAFPGWVSSGAMGKIVMAFCTALPADGGPGAFYVLLRKNGQHPYMPLEREADEDSIEEFARLFGAK